MEMRGGRDVLNIPFYDSGHLKYSAEEERYHYLYAINRFDYPVMHTHLDYWEFCIVTEGTVKNCVMGKGEETCEAGSLHFMTTEDAHRLLQVSEKIRYINISVRQEQLLRMLDAISPAFCERLLAGPRYVPISSVLLAQIEELLHGCNLLSEEQAEQRNGLLCSAVLLILQELNRISLNVQEHLSPFVKKLFALREKKEFLRYTASDLQAALGYSSAHLNRLFRTHFDMTPYAYLRENKFRYARNLLQNTDMSVSEIAYEIGYSNLSHFFSGFKRHYGLTPGECRESRSEKTSIGAESNAF